MKSELQFNKCKISDIQGNVAHATAMGPFGSNIKTENYVSSGVPIIRGKNILNGYYDGTELVYLTEEKADELSGSNTFPEDVLLVAQGNVGHVGYIPKDSKYNRFVLSQNLMKITIDQKKAIPLFIFYYLRSPEGQQEILQYRNPTGVPCLAQPLTSFRNILIPLPELNIQKKIVEYLLNLDHEIQNLENQNKILEQIGQAIFKSWFVDFDGVTEFEDSELGKIPKGWSVKRIKEIAKFNPENIGKDFSFSEIHYLDTSSVTDGIITCIQRLAKNDKPSRAKRLVKKNDILISTVRPNLKHYYFVKNPQKNLVVSTGFVVIRPTGISPFHLYYFLISDSYTEYLTGVADSHTSAYPSFPSEIIKNTKICLPDIESDSISSSFNKILNPMFEKLEFNENQIRSLTKTRDALLPKLMSGEIRV